MADMAADNFDLLVVENEKEKEKDYFNSQSYKVEVIPQHHGLEIHICCKERPQVLGQLVEALEGMGLYLSQANISCDTQDVVMNAVGIQESGDFVDAKDIEKTLVRIIEKD